MRKDFLWDSSSGEPICWIEDGAYSQLTELEAIRLYGEITNEEIGPRGGHRSTTYGTTQFLTNLAKPIRVTEYNLKQSNLSEEEKDIIRKGVSRVGQQMKPNGGMGSEATLCRHCGMDIAIRNPSGYCDHLFYPENCEVCQKVITVDPIRKSEART